MPYGVKRGLRTPGEFGIGDIMGLGLSGAAGIVAALITDYQQQAEASALYTLNHWSVSLGSLIGFTEIPLWGVIVFLIAVGAGSIFYFQPITRQGAFAQGFGLLAVLMTAIPADLAAGIEEIANDENLPGLIAPRDGGDIAGDLVQEVSLQSPSNGTIKSANFRSNDSRSTSGSLTASVSGAVSGLAANAAPNVATNVAVVVKDNNGAASYSVRLSIQFVNGLPDDVNSLIRRGLLRGRLHNQATGETFNLFRTAGGQLRQKGDTIYINAGVPAREAQAKLWVRIECAGHKIEEQSATAKLGTPLNWRMVVKESSTPLFLQRLGKVYRY